MTTVPLSNNESITLPFHEPFISLYLINATELNFTFDLREESCSVKSVPGGLLAFALEGNFLDDGVFDLSEDWNDFFHVSLGKLLHYICQNCIEAVSISCIGGSLSSSVTDSILNACARHAGSIELWGIPNAPKHLYRFKETLKVIPFFHGFMDEESQIMYGELLERDHRTWFTLSNDTQVTDRGFRAILNGLRISGNHETLEFKGPCLDQVSPDTLSALGYFLVESPVVHTVYFSCLRFRNDRLEGFLHPLIHLQRRIRLFFSQCCLETVTAAQLMTEILIGDKLSALGLCGIKDDKVARALAPCLESSKLGRLFVSDCSLFFIGLVVRAISANPNGIECLSFESCSEGFLENLLDLFISKFDFERAKVDVLQFQVSEFDLLDTEAEIFRLVRTIIERNRCIKNLTLRTFSSGGRMGEAITNLVVSLGPTLQSDKMLETFSLGDGFEMPLQYKDFVLGLYRHNTVWTKPHEWTKRIMNLWSVHRLVNFYLDLNKVHRGQIMDPSFPSHLWPEVLSKADKTSLSTLCYCIRSKPEIVQWAVAIIEDQQDDQPDPDGGSKSNGSNSSGSMVL